MYSVPLCLGILQVMSGTTVRQHARRNQDGSVSAVRQHARATTGSSADIDTSAAVAAASEAAIGATDDEPVPRPVPVREAVKMLRELGCRRHRRNAPVVGVARGEDGSVTLTVPVEHDGMMHVWQVEDLFEYQGMGDPRPAAAVVNGRDLCDMLASAQKNAVDEICLHDLDLLGDGAVQIGHEAEDPRCEALRPDDDFDGDAVVAANSLIVAADRLAGEDWNSEGVPSGADPAGFADEAAAAASIISGDVPAPRLKQVAFGYAVGKPRMTVTDAYRLHTTAENVPLPLADADVLLSGEALAEWSRAVKPHLGSPGETLTVDIGERPAGKLSSHDSYALEPRRKFGLRVGQTRFVTQSTGHGSAYPGWANLVPDAAASHPTVAISADDAESAFGRWRKRRVDYGINSSERNGVMRLRTVDSPDGDGIALEYSLTDHTAKTEPAPHSGHLAASSRKPSRSSESRTAVSPTLLLDAVAHAGKGSDDVELRRVSRLKPILVAPAGSPLDPTEIDRFALVMPVRIKPPVKQ